MTTNSGVAEQAALPVSPGKQIHRGTNSHNRLAAIDSSRVPPPVSAQSESGMPPEFDPTTVAVGTRIGAYEVVAQVGQGGMGAVYKVVREGKPFALKIASNKHSDITPARRRELEGRMLREVGTLTTLSHPNIVRCIGFDRWPDMDSGYVYFVTDFVEGDRLYTWQAKHKPSLRHIAGVFIRIADGLSEMHRLEVFHRDLKSDNVLVRKDGEPIIIDFGIARQRSACTLTGTGLLGTLTHLSPGYCRFYLSTDDSHGERYQYRPADDLHAVGLMLYEMLSGKPVFVPNDEDKFLVLRDIATHVPTLPSLINPKIPAALEAIIMKLLAKDESESYRSGAELISTLEAALEKADASWDAPFEPPPSFASQQQTRFDVRGTARARNPRVNGSDDLRALLDSEVPSIASQAISQHPQASAAPFQPPSDIPPSSISPNGSAPTQLQLPEGNPTRADGFEIPSSVRRASILLEKGRGAGLKPQRVLIGAVVLAAVAVLAALAVSRKSAPSQSNKPESLLTAYENSRRQEEKSIAKSLGEPKTDLTAETSETRLPVVGNERTPLSQSPRASSGRNLKNSKLKGGSDAAEIDAMLANTYGRPNISSATGATRVPARPSWLKAPRSLGEASVASKGPRKLGAPFGSRIRAQLRSNLDSRTVGQGPVEAILRRPFIVRGEAVLPSRTLLYGQAQAAGDRFVIHFTKVRLPDDSEIMLNGIAYDTGDGKPGLAAARRISGGGVGGDGVGTKIAKNSANIALSSIGGDPATSVGTSAAQTLLNQTESGGGTAGQDAILLDAGEDFEVFVKEPPSKEGG